jgi:HSP20 family protein
MSRDKEKEKKNGAASAGVEVESSPGHRPDGRRTSLARGESSTPAVQGGDPFAVMRRFAEEMDRVFEGFGLGHGLLSGWPFRGRRGIAPRGGDFEPGAWSPAVEVFEREGRLVIRADLPGLTKDDIHVELKDDAVTIRGERRHEHEERREGYFHSERSYGSFFRRVPLPEGVQADKADASFRDGVLEVTMPAPPREASRARRIEVKG